MKVSNSVQQPARCCKNDLVAQPNRPEKAGKPLLEYTESEWATSNVVFVLLS